MADDRSVTIPTRVAENRPARMMAKPVREAAGTYHWVAIDYDFTGA